MKVKLFITRGCGGAILSGGLKNVYVWFKEPCLEVDLYYRGDPFDKDEERDALTKNLFGVLFSKNTRHNFLYREKNDVNSSFGPKLIRNSDGIDFPPILMDLYNERKLRFSHETFGSGHKINYRPNSVANLFGYDNEISSKIWRLVVQDFLGKDTIDSDDEFRSFDRIEDDKPWWLFCKQIEIEINLSNG